MIEQSPSFSIAELGQKFGAQLAQAYAEIITLEKRLAERERNEARLVGHIEDLKNEIEDLKLGSEQATKKPPG